MQNNTTSGTFKKRQKPYTQVSNSPLLDATLSYRAKGLFATIEYYLNIPNFILYKQTLINASKEGESAFKSAWKELKDKGYLIVNKKRNSEGVFVYEYELVDNPCPEGDFPPLDKPTLENNPSIIISQEITEEEYNKQTALFSNITQIKEKLLTNIRHDYFKQRYALDVFTDEESNTYNAIVKLMIETIDAKKDIVFKASGDVISYDRLTEIFLKLRAEHIDFVLQNFIKIKDDIKNKASYILRSLLTSIEQYQLQSSF